MAVAYSINALKKTGVMGGGTIQFVTKADPVRVLEVLRLAARAVEEPLEAGHLDGEDSIATSAFAKLPDGLAISFSLCDNVELLTMWIQSVAAALDDAGISGRFQKIKWVEMARMSGPALQAVVYLEVSLEEMLASRNEVGNLAPKWWVEPAVSRLVVDDLLDWCFEVPGDVHVFAVEGMRMSAEDAREVVQSSVFTSSRVWVQRVVEEPHKLRMLALSVDGAVTAASLDPDLEWREHLRILEDMLRRCAPYARHGFVRNMWPTAGTSDAWRQPPIPPLLASALPLGDRLSQVIHLRDDYVPDAYVMQVLTGAQLARIGTLPADRWRVEALGNDRHLVTAIAPDPWFAQDRTRYGQGDSIYTRPQVPDEKVLTPARADFAGAILSAEVYEANPQPGYAEWSAAYYGRPAPATSAPESGAHPD